MCYKGSWARFRFIYAWSELENKHEKVCASYLQLFVLWCNSQVKARVAFRF